MSEELIECNPIVVSRNDRSFLNATIPTPEQMNELGKYLLECINTNLKEGRDYGTLPGTKSKILQKSGVEKLAKLFGLIFNFEFIENIVNREGKYISVQ